MGWAEFLRGCVGKLELVPPGMSAAEYLERNRQRAGLNDYEVLASDWRQVGDDLKQAMGQKVRE
jgi:hypothetical protein